jgi:hypothetical protein
VPSPGSARINFRRPKKNASLDGLASLIGQEITGGEDSPDNASCERHYNRTLVEYCAPARAPWWPRAPDRRVGPGGSPFIAGRKSQKFGPLCSWYEARGTCHQQNQVAGSVSVKVVPSGSALKKSTFPPKYFSPNSFTL